MVIVGTENDDLLLGTDANDVIDALGGNDFVFGSAEFDPVTGANIGAGNDQLNGGAGNDILDGGSGDDILSGGDEPLDPATGLPGGDQLYGGGGNDQLFGGAGDDFLDGDGQFVFSPDPFLGDSQGNDELHGGDGKDTLIGRGGDDLLFGDAGDDDLRGGDGIDQLTGGAGNDKLDGGSGADVFKFTFTLTEGQGSTSTFTDFLSQKFGKDFGDHLPDCAPIHHHHHHHHQHDDDDGRHHHHHHKHGKDDGDHDDHHHHHHKHGKDDGHHHHHHHHKHGDCDRHHSDDTCVTEKFFEKNYKEWLREVVVADLLEQGFVLDANGDGKIKIDINEDSRNGTPRIEGLTKQQLAEIFGDRDSVILRDGCDTEKAFYSNSFTSGNGQDSVAGNDGFDTIVDFTFGAGGDKLEFNGLGAGFTLAQFTSFFDANVVDADGDGMVNDTVLALADNSWSVTLLNVSGHTEADFYASSIFS